MGEVAAILETLAMPPLTPPKLSYACAPIATHLLPYAKSL